MDIDFKKLLTSDVIKQVAKEAGEKPKATKSVLTGALPLLGNLLGGQETTENVATQVAEKTGSKLENVIKIITAALPILKNLLAAKATDAVTAVAGGKTGLLGKLGSLFGGKD